MVLKNWTQNLDFTELRPSLGSKNGQKVRREGNERKINGQRKEKSTDFAFIFYIVDFGDSFWREKNARLRREFNFSTPFS